MGAMLLALQRGQAESIAPMGRSYKGPSSSECAPDATGAGRAGARRLAQISAAVA